MLLEDTNQFYLDLFTCTFPKLYVNKQSYFETPKFPPLVNSRNAGRKQNGLDFRVYLFNLTNIDGWMNGSVEKLHVEELGPYVYQEIWTKKNITFHE